MSTIRAIGFDLGETLIFYRGIPMNWAAHYPDALAAVAAALKFSPSAAQFAEAQEILLKYNTRIVPRTHEMPAKLIFVQIYDRWGIDPSKDVAIGIKAFFSFFQQDVCSYPDAAPALVQLRQCGLPVGLLTDVPYGMPTEFVKSDLTRAGLADFFDALVTSVDVGYRKPEVAGFLKLSEKLRVRPKELLYIGNEPKDIQGAKAAGAQSALIDRDNASPDYGQDHTIRSLEELLNLITNLTWLDQMDYSETTSSCIRIPRLARQSGDTKGVEALSPGLPDSERATPGRKAVPPIIFARSAASKASISHPPDQCGLLI